MEQERRFFDATLVSIRRQTEQHINSRISILFGFLRIIFQLHQLQQSGSYNGRCRCVSRSVRDSRIVEIPIRNIIFRQTFEVYIRYFLGKTEVFLITGFPVNQRIPINGPCLSARPQGAITISFVTPFKNLPSMVSYTATW